jgi:hypothetical protein
MKKIFRERHTEMHGNYELAIDILGPPYYIRDVGKQGDTPELT